MFRAWICLHLRRKADQYTLFDVAHRENDYASQFELVCVCERERCRIQKKLEKHQDLRFVLLFMANQCVYSAGFAVTAWLDFKDLYINARVSMHACICVYVCVCMCVYVCGRAEDRRGLRRC